MIKDTIDKLKNLTFKPTLGKIFEINAKYIPKEKHKLLLEVLNHNEKEIKEYVYPELRGYKSNFNFKEICYMINKTGTFKCKNITPGILFSFTCDKENVPNSEFTFVIPKNHYEYKYPQAQITLNYNFESKNFMRRYRMLKTMLKTNKCKIIEEFNEKGNEVTLVNVKPTTNVNFWGTIRFFFKKYLQDLNKE